jgi:hypothetical protein
VCRGRNENILWFDVSVKEMMVVDVLEAVHNLEQDAFDTGIVKALVIARLHQLIQVAFHILHTNVKLFTERIQEDVESRHKMWVLRKSSQEDDFS